MALRDFADEPQPVDDNEWHLQEREYALVVPSLDPSLVRPGFADQFLERIIETNDAITLWEDAKTCDGLAQKWHGHVEAQDEAVYLQLYLEIQLGQVLGPKPGKGPGRGKKDQNFDVIPAAYRELMRRFYGHRDWLYPAIPKDRELPRKERQLDSRNGALLAVRTREARERLRTARAQASTGPLPAGLLDLDVADACKTWPLEDDAVDLIVTSPPYALDVAYEGGDVAHDAWPRFMATWMAEALRVTKPHGRLALNIPLDTSIPSGRPSYALAVGLALGVGWEYAATIVWNENNTTKGGWALGTQSSSRRPHHVSQVEMIAILSKGPMGPSSSNPDDITPEEFLLAGRGPWTFSGESRPWEGHPAPFPLELPRRLIPYLCRVGDVVLDPFVGSGTTLVAALERGRRCYGYDLSDEYVESARRRVAAMSSVGP